MPDETKEQEKVSTTEQWHTPTPRAFCPDIVLSELWRGGALGIVEG